MNHSIRILGLACGLALLAATASAQYPKRGIRLLANVPLSAFSGVPANGSAVVNYVSQGGKEFAIMGATNGKHFFDISNPTSPIQVGFVATPAGSLWQEMVVVNDYCYGVSEHSATQVIDLRSIDSGTVSHVNTWLHTWFDPATSTTITLQNRAHTAQGSNRSSTVYLNGARDTSSPAKYYMVALDVSNPASPTVAGYWSMYDPDSKNSSKIVYIHDCEVVHYDTGPYAGKEIMFACCGYDGLYVLDVTNKANIQLLSKYTYLPANTYAHSGSLSPDRTRFYLNDEFDEAYGGASNTTHIFDVSNLNAVSYIGADAHGNNFIDHNSIIQDNKLLVSSYAGGVRVFDFSNPNDLNEIGYLDTLPASDYKDYVANWGVAGGLPSGNITLSDMQSGLFVLDPSEALGFGAVPISESFAKGFKAAGSFGDSRKSDDKRLHYQGLSTGMSVTIVLETTMNVTGAGSFKLEARSANSPVQLTVQARNLSTGKWVTLGKPSLGAADSVFSVPVADVTPYFSGSAQAQVRLTLPRKARGATADPGVQIDALNFVTN